MKTISDVNWVMKEGDNAAMNWDTEVVLTIFETVVITSTPIIVEVCVGLMMKIVVYVSVKVSV